MIDEEKLIKILSRNSIFEKITMADGRNIYEIIDDMPKELKLKPKPPIFEGDGYADGELVYDTWYCPNCDADYEIDEKHSFCPRCGQAIKWEE